MSTHHSSPRILIVGCGGIGGVLGATLLRRGWAVHIATTNAAVRRAWMTTGPYLQGNRLGIALAGKYLADRASAAPGKFDFIFVAVQPPQMETVGLELSGKLSAAGRVVCLSNGWCEPLLSRHVEATRLIGAVVTWGARMRRPGHYERTSHGGFLVGSFSPQFDPGLQATRALLNVVAPAQITHNLKGARFSKLAINCAISALGTIGGDSLGRLLRRKQIRSLGIELIREAVQVAHADRVQLEQVGPIDLSKLVALDQEWFGPQLQHGLLLLVGARYRKLRSSMLSALERGRAPAVEFLNGEISRRGQALEVQTPYNMAATAIIWAIARGELAAGPGAIDQLERQGKLS